MQGLYNTISLITIVVLFLILLFQKEGRKRISLSDDASVVKIDTFIRIVSDTIWQKEVVTFNKITTYAADTVYISNFDTIREYSGVKEDSTILINYLLATNGSLNLLELGYILKKPLLITKYVDKEITVEKLIKEKVFLGGVFLGGSSGYSVPNQRYSAELGVSLLTPKGTLYSYDYDLINKAHSFGLRKKIFNVR